LTLNPEAAARLELNYWDLARRINKDISREALLDTMTALHAEIFSLPPEVAAESAELRVQAIELLREITGNTAIDPARNWSELEKRLQACYRSVRAAIQSRDRGVAATLSTLVPT
jgi:hypothetical protein